MGLIGLLRQNVDVSSKYRPRILVLLAPVAGKIRVSVEATTGR